MIRMEKLSVAVPCYNEQEVLPIFYDEIVKVAETLKDELEFELIFINDGSKDNTIDVIRKLRHKDSRVGYQNPV